MVRFLWWVPLGLLVPGLGAWRVGRRGAALVTWLVVQGSLTSALLFFSEAPAQRVWAVVIATPMHITLLVAQAVHGAWVAKNAVARWWSVLLAAALAFSVSTSLNLLVTERLESFKVPSASMRPTLVEGDQFFVMLDWESFPIERGSVVVFRDEHDVAFVKRVVGLPGDLVAWNGEELTVTTEALPDVPLSLATGEACERNAAGARCEFEEAGPRRWRVWTGGASGPTGEWEVPEDHVFMMGDNRGNSHDSRVTGPVPVDQLVGRAEVIHWSWPALSRIGHAVDGLQPAPVPPEASR